MLVTKINKKHRFVCLFVCFEKTERKILGILNAIDLLTLKLKNEKQKTKTTLQNEEPVVGLEDKSRSSESPAQASANRSGGCRGV